MITPDFLGEFRMKKNRGKKIKLSLARRSVIDLMHFSQKMSLNSVSAERYLKLEPLIEARKVCPHKISWYALFFKAFAKVSEEMPELRQSYFPLMFPNIYQYNETAGSIAMEREIDGETFVVYLHISHPQHHSLLEIDNRIKQAKDCPPHEIPSFRRFLKINRFPFLIRRFLWWVGLNVYSYRFRYFGTFALTGIGRGVRSLSVKSPMSVTFVFDMSMTDILPLVRLFWDHRVFDGVIVIRILERLQYILNHDLVEEMVLLSKEEK